MLVLYPPPQASSPRAAYARQPTRPALASARCPDAASTSIACVEALQALVQLGSAHEELRGVGTRADASSARQRRRPPCRHCRGRSRVAKQAPTMQCHLKRLMPATSSCSCTQGLHTGLHPRPMRCPEMSRGPAIAGNRPGPGPDQARSRPGAGPQQPLQGQPRLRDEDTELEKL